MPQLNYYNYLNLITWFILFITIFHIYMKIFIIPKFYEFFYLLNKN